MIRHTFQFGENGDEFTLWLDDYTGERDRGYVRGTVISNSGPLDVGGSVFFYFQIDEYPYYEQNRFWIGQQSAALSLGSVYAFDATFLTCVLTSDSTVPDFGGEQEFTIYLAGRPIEEDIRSRVKHKGTWHGAVVYVNVDGDWKVAHPFVRVDGEWVESI